MDADVAKLVGEQRLVEAARLSSERGDAHGASLLYERACEWRCAAVEALRAGEAGRALDLAVEGGDDDTADRAARLVASDAASVDASTARLAERGRHGWAARVLEASGRALEAAAAWERAGDTMRAAAAFAGGGKALDAARVLEAALRRDPAARGVAVALGSLLQRFGKHEAAVRVLQRVPRDSQERIDALAQLVPAFERMGLTRAAVGAAIELAALGGTPRRDEPGAPEALPSRLFGRYDVVREVASSPSAHVLECIDAVRGERVAVKILAAWDARGSGRDALVRFEREVRAMRSLEHPHVVPFRDFIPDAPAIVLAWMAGGTLEKMLAESGALAPRHAVEIACAVLSALADAHRLGILHRDVKPANVLFDESAGARLGDFGVAHLGDLSTTATAGTFGTLAYMSPEQREGRPATTRSDVFAVGAMLQEMLTGERASPNASPPAPSRAHRQLDARHDALVRVLTAPDPNDRPAGASEARSALLALPWPMLADSLSTREAGHRRASERPRESRAARRLVDSSVDEWTGRAVERVPLSERALVRARAFAQSDHPALQMVLRADRDDGALWLAAPGGYPLDRPLAADERSGLEEALRALHRAGVVHGSVDADHVVVTPRGIMLLFAGDPDSTAVPDGDWLALSRLLIHLRRH